MPSDLNATTNVADVSARLRLSITRLARQLRQMSEGDLTPTQLSVLATISNHGPLTLGEVAERERVAAPTITKVVGVLVDRGLIERTPDPSDRRFVRVTLTDAGDSLLERTRARRTAWLTQQLRNLDEDDLESLSAAADVLDRLTRHQET